MPKKIKLESHLESHLSTAELESRYRDANDPIEERSHYQIAWLISQGKTTAEVMEVTGYSRNWIQSDSRAATTKKVLILSEIRGTRIPVGRIGLCSTKGSARNWPSCSKSVPKDGGMWNSRKVAEWIESRTGRRVSSQRGWEYLRRLGNTPKVPRSFSREG